MKVERMIERGRRETRGVRRGSIESIMSEDNMRNLLRGNGAKSGTDTVTDEDSDDGATTGDEFEGLIMKKPGVLSESEGEKSEDGK